MTCEQIKETLDTVNQSEAVARHLNGCAACRKEAAATAKLVSLLHAQPAVKAPADFMAQLQLRMATESANENVRLKSLLQAVPAVTAPPDFAFRVRARLARTAAPARNPLAVIGEWLAQSFSFKHAAGAMAAIALIATFTTMQLRNNGSTPATPVNMMAKVDKSTSVPVNVAPVATDSNQRVATTQKPVRIPRATFAHASAKAASVVEPKTEVAMAEVPARSAIEPAVYSAKTGQEVAGLEHGYTFGQQLGKVMAQQQKPETMIASVVF